MNNGLRGFPSPTAHTRLTVSYDVAVTSGDGQRAAPVPGLDLVAFRMNTLLALISMRTRSKVRSVAGAGGCLIYVKEAGVLHGGQNHKSIRPFDGAEVAVAGLPAGVSWLGGQSGLAYAGSSGRMFGVGTGITGEGWEIYDPGAGTWGGGTDPLIPPDWYPGAVYVPTIDRVAYAFDVLSFRDLVVPVMSTVAGLAGVTGGVAYSPLADRVAACRPGDGTVVIVNPATYAVVATTGVGGRPRAVCYNPRDRRFWVVCETTRELWALTEEGVAVRRVALPEDVLSATASPDGRFVVAFATSEARAYMVDVATFAVAAEVSLS